MQQTKKFNDLWLVTFVFCVFALIINGIQKPVQLHNGTRFLVHRGNITTAASKKLHFFLFNDIILLTKAQGDRYKLLHNIELVKSSMEASSEGFYELAFPTNEKLQFRVTDKSLENLEVCSIHQILYYSHTSSESKNKSLNIRKRELSLVYH